jgi:uncharacterized membrane protein YphA (DoxX/SURF4 family)
MGNQQKSSKELNITLWIVQMLLASSLIWSSWMKLFQPVQQLAAMWPWAGEVSPSLIKFTGIVDLLGGLGLVLPAGLRIQPKLTPIAAMGIIALMICASAFHISRGESGAIGPNIVFALMAGFVAWGRWRKGTDRI